MAMEVKTINLTGIEEIRGFLATHHKKGHDMTEAMIVAWCEEAEDSLGNGNPPMIEIRSYDSVTGRPETLTVSPDDVDTQVIDDE
jgi:hypothetical protein